MAVPSEFVGAWRRCGLFLDGYRQVDYCDVLWLQTPELFADIRLLIDPAVSPPTRGVSRIFAQERAFAGVATWAAPIMTWSHLLDSNLDHAVDANSITVEDRVFVERGSVSFEDRQVLFVEEWMRLSRDDALWTATQDEAHIRVELGRWAIEMIDERPGGTFSANRWEKGPLGWMEIGSTTGQ